MSCNCWHLSMRKLYAANPTPQFSIDSIPVRICRWAVSYFLWQQCAGRWYWVIYKSACQTLWETSTQEIKNLLAHCLFRLCQNPVDNWSRVGSKDHKKWMPPNLSLLPAAPLESGRPDHPSLGEKSLGNCCPISTLNESGWKAIGNI